MTYSSDENDNKALQIWHLKPHKIETNKWLNNNFEESATEWYVEKLINDLEEIKGRKLTNIEKVYLCCCLCGYGAEDIARNLFKGKQGVKTELCNQLAPLIKGLLEINQQTVPNILQTEKIRKHLKDLGYKRRLLIPPIEDIIPPREDNHLSKNFQDLSPLQQIVMYSIALNQGSILIAELQASMILTWAKSRVTLQQQLNSLRTLIEINQEKVTMQADVLDCVTHNFVNLICENILKKSIMNLEALNKLQLKKNQYNNNIIETIANKIIIYFTSTERMIEHFRTIIQSLQKQEPLCQGFLSANIFNLLCELPIDLKNWDFSRLTLREPDLRTTKLIQTNFAQAKFKKPMLPKLQNSITAIAYCQDSKLIATQSSDRTIKLWKDEQCLTTLNQTTRTPQPIMALKFQDRGQILIGVTADHIAVGWNVRTWNLINLIDTDFQFTDIDQYFASVTQEGTIKIICRTNDKCISTLKPELPFQGMNITETTGLTELERTQMKALGAVEF